MKKKKPANMVKKEALEHYRRLRNIVANYPEISGLVAIEIDEEWNIFASNDEEEMLQSLSEASFAIAYLLKKSFSLKELEEEMHAAVSVGIWLASQEEGGIK